MKIKAIGELAKYGDTDKWLIQDLILSSGLSILVANPKCSKSFFSLNCAISVCAQLPCLNHYKTNEKGRVLYYSGEDSENIVRERLEGLLKARGIAELDNLGILTSSNGLRIDTDEGIQALRSQMDLFKPTLLILDPFCHLHQVNENDSGSVASVLKNLRHLRDAYKCAILLVHHTAKATDTKAVGSRIRGSSFTHSFFESILALRKDQNGDIFLDAEHRAAPSFQNVPIELKSDESGISYRVKTLTQPQSMIEESTVEDCVIEFVQYKIPVSLEDLAQRTKLTVPELRQAIYRLLKIGKLTWTKQGYLRGSIQ